MRMQMRRFTRLTNAFSKKFENHCHMVALYAVSYNFVKMHKTLKMTPAMASGVSKRLWSMEDIVALIEQREAGPGYTAGDSDRPSIPHRPRRRATGRRRDCRPVPTRRPGPEKLKRRPTGDRNCK